MHTELEIQLLKKRFQGAANLKGIDFQIHYALNKALNLLSKDNPIEKISFEGIEDIDLMPFKEKNTYIQVKTSINSWHLKDLQKPFLNFIKLNNISPEPQSFELALNFVPRETIIRLLSKEINISDKEITINELIKLKEFKTNGITKNQIINIVTNCELRYIKKVELVQDTKNKIFDLLEIHPSEVELFSLSLLYKFLDWSIDRQTITKLDLINFKIRFKENQARSIEFEAYGKGLIERISWDKECVSSDYFEGKKTRSSHIANNLDIKRPKWQNKIAEVFTKTNVCIIREASGQGKSTLAFRYAHDCWSHENTFCIKVVETAEQAEQISNYLKGIEELGLNISVIIDDINIEKKYFSKVLQNCADIKIPFLITSRNDDYNIFGSIIKVSLEFINPYFDRDEAKLIFNRLKSQNRIHSSILSSDWAYEKIDSPKSLIEFIFLITQGEMLIMRLTEQINRMHDNNEIAKINLLRKVIIADFCKTPININTLTSNGSENIDYQGIINSLKDEFIIIENEKIQGYHWVRSAHLLEILHQNYANPAITALKTITIIEENERASFIGNLFKVLNFDVNVFIENYNTIPLNNYLNTYLSFIDGLFKIGEYQFFISNKEHYDEAYDEFNDGVLVLFNAKFLPTKSRDLFEVFGDDPNFKKAKSISLKFKNGFRGFDLVQKFIEVNTIKVDYSVENIEIISKIIDWTYWLKIKIVDEDKFEELIYDYKINELDLSQISLFSICFYRLNSEKYFKWYSSKKDILIKKVERDLKCIISLTQNSISITYSEKEDIGNYNDATMRRLNTIRTVFPFLELYKGFCNISDPKKFFGDHDNSQKNISSEHLPIYLDIEKNLVLSNIVESHYRIQTWYEFSQYYYDLRKYIVNYCTNLCKILNGQQINFKGKDAQFISDSILHSHKNMPYDIEQLNSLFKGCRDCFNSFNNFLLHKSKINQNDINERDARLMFINLNDFLIKISYMQEFFQVLKNFAPDYFPFKELIEKENTIFKGLKVLIKINIPNSENYCDLNSGF
jgi:hypothetical protein